MGKQTLSSDDFVGWAKSWASKNKATEKISAWKLAELIVCLPHSRFVQPLGLVEILKSYSYDFLTKFPWNQFI